jgi:hypothetical protein
LAPLFSSPRTAVTEDPNVPLNVSTTDTKIIKRLEDGPQSLLARHLSEASRDLTTPVDRRSKKARVVTKEKEERKWPVTSTPQAKVS